MPTEPSAAPARPAPRQTCLHQAHRALGAQLTEFAGWSMPLQYDGILAEHRRTRAAVSMFDTGHMGEFLVSGAAALDALSAAVTPDLCTLRDGRCRYGFLLREDGGILDDLIVYRFDAARWMIVVNAGTREADAACLRARLPSAVAFRDAAGELSKLDVQGPAALAAVSRALDTDLADLPRFACRETVRGGVRILASRTGYTGEDGFELYAPPEAICRLWDEFLRAGVRPAGLGARDTLRLEAALPLYGHELSVAVTPVEAGLDRYARKPEPFVGRDALERRRRTGVARRLCGFRCESRQTARHGCRVLADGADVGWVTSGSFAPTLGCSIGLAYVEPRYAAPGARLTLATERKPLAAVVVPTPFYRRAEP